MNDIKTCSTCGHAKGRECMAGGYNQLVERKYGAACRSGHEAWIPKPPRVGFFPWIKSIFFGG